MNKKSHLQLISTVFVGLLCSSLLAAPSLLVIANPDSKISTLTKNQLMELYLSKPINLKFALLPYNLPNNTQAYQNFYRQVLDWNASDVSRYWSAQIFSGQGNQPSMLSNAQQAIAMVEKNPHAIAYVMSNDLSEADNNKIKILYGNYRPMVTSPLAYQNNAYFHGANGFSKPVTTAPTSSPNRPNTKPVQTITQQSQQSQQSQQQPSQTFAPMSAGVWGAIQTGIHLGQSANNTIVSNQINWYLNHRLILNTIIANASPYIFYIYQQTQLHNMPVVLALLPLVESGYDPQAYSRSGAAGLWQMMPATASLYHLDSDWWYDPRRDIIISTHTSLNYLTDLYRNFNSWGLAVAAYDAGQNTVQTAINTNKNAKLPIDFWSLPLPKETRDYIPKLLALAAIIKNADVYHVALPYVPLKPFFMAFAMRSQLDIAEISYLAHVSPNIIEKLNPGMRRWATPPGHYILLLPINNAATFEENLRQLVGKKHYNWQYHEVYSNENLDTIAHNYHTKVEVLREVNHLSSDMLMPDSGILVPLWLGHVYKKPEGLVNLMDNSISTDIHAPNTVPTTTNTNPPPINTDSTNAQPIDQHDSLKTLLRKIYGRD